jgi:hypothetical protein
LVITTATHAVELRSRYASRRNRARFGALQDLGQIRAAGCLLRYEEALGGGSRDEVLEHRTPPIDEPVVYLVGRLRTTGSARSGA